jgi:hypothetical protein
MRAYIEFSSLAYNFIISKNEKLKSFHENLNSDTTAGKKEVLNYLIYNYPIIIPGNKGRQIHHHTFNILDSSKTNILKEKTLINTEDFDCYKLNFIDYKYFETSEYDNIRYVWWNPYVENFRDPKFISGMPNYYSDESNIEESGMVAIINYFKTTLIRSTENLQRLFNLFKTPFFLIVSKEMYEDLKIKNSVNSLLVGREYFLKKDKEGLISKLEEEHFGKPKYANSENSPARVVGRGNWSWYYTFWDRRASEGNEEIVYSILKEIKNNYQ